MSVRQRLLIWVLALLAPSFAAVIAVHTAASTWERVRTKPQQRSLQVTGSAVQRIESDLIEWSARVETHASDRTEAYRALRQHIQAATDYLTEQGIGEADLRVSSVTAHELIDTEYIGTGAERVQRRVSRGWQTSQELLVRSHDIPRVERVSREITQLLEQGVPISSRAPRYHYTKLGELKIDMLARASENARVRAERIVQAAGGEKPTKLLAADMGVININPANSTATSWEGNNDKTSFEKDIITIVHLTFELPD